MQPKMLEMCFACHCLGLGFRLAALACRLVLDAGGRAIGFEASGAVQVGVPERTFKQLRRWDPV